MKLNLNQVLVDMDGKPHPNVDQERNEYGIPMTGSDGKPKIVSKGDLKLGDLLLVAVNAVYPDEQKLNPSDIYERGKMARKVKGGGEKNFSSEEITKVLMPCIERRLRTDPELMLTIAEILDPEKFKPVVAAEESATAKT